MTLFIMKLIFSKIPRNFFVKLFIFSNLENIIKQHFDVKDR